jgi:hypothetical protein
MRCAVGLIISILLLIPISAASAIEPREGWGPTSELTRVRVADFDGPEGWTSGAGNAASRVALGAAAGAHGSALRVEYSLPTEPQNNSFVFWVKPSGLDVSKAGRISFWIRGEGPPNEFSFKIKDGDGGVFLRRFPAATRTSEWRREEADISEWNYGWGGKNATPDPPFTLDVGVVRSYSTQGGGRGWIELAQLEQIGANPHLQMLLNQIGFDPEMSKRAVVALVNRTDEIQAPLTYSVLTYPGGRVAATGQAPKFPGSDLWPGQYWVISCDTLRQTGRYTIKAVLPAGGNSLTVESYPFSVAPGVLDRELSQAQFHYIRSTRYPAHPPHRDPVPGGYIDTEFDIEKWMTTTPTWAWAMAHWQRLLGNNPVARAFDPLDEIRYATRFGLAMQDDSTGGVYLGVGGTRPTPWEQDVTVDTDLTDRFLRRQFAPEVNAAYAAAMAETALALRKKDPALAKSSLDAAVKAWRYLAGSQLSGIQYLGMFLWASTRLYAATGDADYLEAAKVVAAKLLPYQDLDYRHNQDQVFGVFYSRPDKADFAYQYKFVHSVGLYLGLLELAETLPASDPLTEELRFHLDCFAYGFLKRTAELNPFGRVAQSLEPPEKKNLPAQVYYFASPQSPLGQHGLNCDILSLGLVALRYARLAKNPEFAKLAVDQISWVLGTNPAGFCMVSGRGTTNPHVWAADWNKGPVLGGIPNGFVSPGARNKPQWMMDWYSGEYWKPHNAMLLALMAELESGLEATPFTPAAPPPTSLETIKAEIDRRENLRLRRKP